MRDTEFYQQVLGLSDNWQVADVNLDIEGGEVEILVVHAGGGLSCPVCGFSAPVHDHAPERSWRHLDTCQLKTLLHCRVPRVKCSEHGVKTVSVPWAEPHGRFTALFEQVVIRFLHATRNKTAVAERLGLTFDEVHSIMERAVERGLARRDEHPMRQLGLDEKSMKRGHNYLTVLTDLENSCVHDVAEGRKQVQAESLLNELSELQRKTVTCVCMDMWEPYRRAVEKILPNAAVVHDRFHISQHLNDAVDSTRRRESRQLSTEQLPALKHSRYLFLRNYENLLEWQATNFKYASRVAVKTAGVWESKELFREFWNQPSVANARTFLARWYKDAKAKKLPELNKVAKMILRHAKGLLTYFDHKVTNAMAENLNGKIQQLKSAARGFRSFERYRVNILFHYGKLSMEPLKIL